MRGSIARLGLSCFVCLFVVGAVMLTGCAEQPAPPEGDAYSSRGIITQMPGDRPGSGLMIRHEPMPDFKNAEGEPDPMSSMSMPFPLGEGVSAQGLSTGDKVAFQFRVVWAPPEHAGWTLTSIQKLPDDTELNFGEAAPQSEAHQHHEHNHAPAQTHPATSN